jgi:hypothetical protein
MISRLNICNMKTLIIFVFFSSILLNNSNAQTLQKHFLGKHYLLYKGVVLVFDNDQILGLDSRFYDDYSVFNTTRWDSSRNVIYPDNSIEGIGNLFTTPDSLFNRVFLVTDIIESDELRYSDDPLLVLEDTLTKQIIYYKYDKRSEHDWPFLSNEIKIEYDKEMFCSYIVRKYDPFTGATTFNTPLVHSNKRYSTMLIKSIEGNSVNYYLSLHLSTERNSGSGNNVILLFEDDSTINKQAKVKYDGIDNIGNTYWNRYSAMVPLNKNDLNTLISKELRGFRLHVYDRFIHDDLQRIYFKSLSECVIESELTDE